MNGTAKFTGLADSEAALAGLRAFAAEPLPAPAAIPPKVEKPEIIQGIHEKLMDAFNI